MLDDHTALLLSDAALELHQDAAGAGQAVAVAADSGIGPARVQGYGGISELLHMVVNDDAQLFGQIDHIGSHIRVSRPKNRAGYTVTLISRVSALMVKVCNPERVVIVKGIDNATDSGTGFSGYSAGWF